MTCLPRDQVQYGKVVKIIDGDTVDVEIDGAIYPVRYIGIDTPEISTKSEYYGEQAKAYNSLLVLNKKVILLKDNSETDRYSRLLRYVIVDGLFVNYELVRKGYAESNKYVPDVACDQTLSDAETYARTNKFGMWLPTPAPIPETNRFATLPASLIQNPNCDPSYPGVCIPPPPPDLDCKDIPYRQFTVNSPDPHNFDGDHDGIGCEN
jgi:micrococcal nuclease